MSNFRLLSQTGTIKVFADPDDISHSFKEQIEVSPKMAGKVRLNNVRQTFTEGSFLTVTDGTESGKDQFSMKFVISASSASAEEVKVAASRFMANVSLALANGTAQGFTTEGITYVAGV